MLKKIFILISSMFLLNACQNGVAVRRDYSNGVWLAKEDKIFFATDSAKLSIHAIHQLKTYVEKYKKESVATITIYGHAAERGKHHYNLNLSQERAKVVMHYLHHHGVKARLNIVAQGAKFTTHFGKGKYSLSQNRVAELVAN